MCCVWYMCTVSSMVIFLINKAEHKLNLPVIKSISTVCNYTFIKTSNYLQ